MLSKHCVVAHPLIEIYCAEPSAANLSAEF